ncbi:MAG TPA: glycosyltransferase family 4 protein [Symbiobacteriaceae bacterium]|nr:glycosyltransferase family 4 protein [Symbiobacteriaceae bacterium]
MERLPGARDGRNVLIVGPVPPPVGGASVSFKTFLDAWTVCIGSPGGLINTSARYLKTTRKLKFSDVIRGISVAWKLWQKAPRGGTILAFVNNGFYLRYAAFLSLLQRVRNVRVVLSFFGGNLYNDLMSLSTSERKRILGHLSQVKTTIVETQNLLTNLSGLGLQNLVSIPGYRRIAWESLPEIPRDRSPEMKLVFLSHVKPEKGVGELLGAVESVNRNGCRIHCDIFGPIVAEFENEFHQRVNGIPGVKYCGVANGGTPALLAGYDALVLPTWYPGEGHPGVIIESMMAGIPVVATRFRAIPELVEDGVNGRLCEPRDVASLCQVLEELAHSPDELLRMGVANRQRLMRHDVFKAVDTVYGIISSGESAPRCPYQGAN